MQQMIQQRHNPSAFEIDPDNMEQEKVEVTLIPLAVMQSQVSTNDYVNNSYGGVGIDGVNSKLSSFLEETKIKGVNDGTLTLILENGNNFIKKVLESDSKVITDIIEKDYKIVVEIKIEVSGPAKTEDVIESDKLEEEHPLLDDAVKIFKGKMIS